MLYSQGSAAKRLNNRLGLESSKDMRIQIARVGVIAAALLLLGSCPMAAAQSGDIAERLQARLAVISGPSGHAVAGRSIASNEFLPKLYAALGNKLAWSRSEDVKSLAEAVSRSWEDGLLPADFHADFVKAEASGTASSIDPIDRDVVLSDAYVRLLYQLYFGKVDPNGLDPNWNFSRPVVDEEPAAAIANALASGQIGALIERVRMHHPLYVELKSLLQQYTDYDVSGGWRTVPAGPVLKPGQKDARVAALRARLQVTGEYEGPPSGDTEVYDEGLVAALKDFQVSHGIEPDGALGPETVAALNVTAHERTEQIRVNMERGRWLLRTLSPEMVIVNVAGQYLHLFLKGEKVWSTRVIVGKPYTKTPIFTETMRTIVFNPDWTVPRSIVRNEIFAKASADPGYLAANNYYLRDSAGRQVQSFDWNAYTAASIPYSVVQRPGPRNALGLVKFLFPNRYSVYLHDTPSRQLFAKAGRNFSHGCIRVEDPLRLAELILADRNKWDRAKVDAAVASGKLQGVALATPLPVLILYWTVDPSPVGGTAFYKDIYGRDAQLLKALNAEFKPARRS
jgi:murein L,D-transpeptidase YcbB/YkuD